MKVVVLWRGVSFMLIKVWYYNCSACYLILSCLKGINQWISATDSKEFDNQIAKKGMQAQCLLCRRIHFSHFIDVSTIEGTTSK